MQQQIMDRRLVTAAGIMAILIITAAFFLFTRPITGTWVCTDRLTESAMISDEVTTITLQPDGIVFFRSYATSMMWRYRIRDGYGHWEPAGFGKYAITITQGTDVSCSVFENCTPADPKPFNFSVDHDLIRDTIAYDPAAAPEFTSIRPFVRSIVMDCSNGCPG